MGCDIHTYVECQPSYSGDSYRCFAKLNINRQYALFAVLADVRNSENITYVADPKGIPTRLSWQAEAAYEEIGSDAHSTSWLTIDEVSKAINILYEVEGADISELEAILDVMGHLKEPRLVFWFDN